ncbi:MAG: hypothetical protein ACOYK8_07465 [Alphaproteobacteria bacterium]
MVSVSFNNAASGLPTITLQLADGNSLTLPCDVSLAELKDIALYKPDNYSLHPSQLW